MEPYIGDSHYPFVLLVHNIHFEILCEELVPETMFDIKGKWPIGMKISAFPDKYEIRVRSTSRNIYGVFDGNQYPKLQELYGGVMPTAHHVNMLINNKILNAISIKRKGVM